MASAIRRSVVIGILTAVLVSACGGDDDTSTTETSSPAPSTLDSSVPATSAASPATIATPPSTAEPSGDGGLMVAGVDPCGLLDVDSIVAVVAHPVVDGEPQPLSCLWDSETLEDAAVTVSLFPDATGDVAGACADQRALDPGADEVEGFGSSAWWVYNAVGPPYDSGDLWFCVDDGIVAVSLSGAGDEALWRSQVEQLAATVVAGL